MNNKIDPTDLDTTLAPIIANALKQHIQLQKEDAFPSYPDCFNSQEEWLDVLDKMLYAFDQYAGPCISDYNTGIGWHEIGVTEEGYKRMEITVDDEQEFNRYKFDCEAHEEAVTKGLYLFAKYYGSLWV